MTQENGLKETEIGLIPNDWEVKVIANVVEKAKQTDPTKTPDCSFRYVDVTSVSKDALKITEYKDYMGENAPGRARKSIQTEDVIFATVRPTLRRIAYIDELFNGEICSTAFCVLRSKKDKLFSRYLYYYVQRDEFVDELAKLQRGASYPAVTDSDIKNQRILLPSLNEQVSIAFVLSKIQQTIEQQEKIIAKTKELKRSLMHRLFTYGLRGEELKETEIGLMPKSWDVKKINQFAKVKYGKQKPKIAGPIPVVGSSGIYAGCKDALINFPTLIVGRKGTAGAVHLFLEPCWPSDTTFYLEWISDEVKPKFLYYYMLTHLLSGEHAKTTMPSLQRQDLEGYIFPFPSEKEQTEITDIIDKVNIKLSQAEARKQTLQSLFKSILQLLMTGQVRVKDIDFGVDYE